MLWLRRRVEMGEVEREREELAWVERMAGILVSRPRGFLLLLLQVGWSGFYDIVGEHRVDELFGHEDGAQFFFVKCDCFPLQRAQGPIDRSEMWFQCGERCGFWGTGWWVLRYRWDWWNIRFRGGWFRG